MGSGKKRNRSGRFGCESANRLQLGDLRTHRMNDPPAARERAERDGSVRSKDDPERNRQAPALRELKVSTSDECSGDDAHRFLRIVAAVAEAVRRGGEQLQAPEPLIDATRREAV